MAGRRVAHATPVQLFVVTNILFYLVSTKAHFTPFQTGLNELLGGANSTLLRRLVGQHLTRTGESFAAYAPRFDELVHVYSKTLVFVFVPLLALPLALLCWRQRRYFVEWLTITLYWFGGVLLLFGLVAALAFGAYFFPATAWFFNDDRLILPFMFSSTTLYTLFFLRGVFPGRAWFMRLAQATALTFCFLQALVSIYRPLLFLLTLWTT